MSFADDEGFRFRHRDAINTLVEAGVASLGFDALKQRFDDSSVCWAPYRTLSRAIATEPRLVSENPIFTDLAQPSGHRYPVPGFAGTLGGEARHAPRPAPRLGADTEQVLAEVLGCSAGEIAGMHDRGIVASAAGGNAA